MTLPPRESTQSRDGYLRTKRYVISTNDMVRYFYGTVNCTLLHNLINSVVKRHMFRILDNA